MLRSLLALLVLAVPLGVARADDDAPAPAEPKRLEKVERPFLWRLETKAPCFLLGTAHVVDPRVLAMHPAANEAFEAAEAFYAEVDFIKDVAAQLEAMRMPQGKTLEGVAGLELLARLRARLKKISPMLDVGLLPGELYPAAWAILIGSLREQFKNPGAAPLDAKLFTEAMRAGKVTGGLEKPIEQIGVLRELDDADQVLMLTSTLDQWDITDAEGTDPTDELLELYLAGDEERMLAWAEAQLTVDGQLPEAFTKRLLEGLLYGRNERIAKRIVQLVAEHPERRQFFAVGAMHLIGPRSVQHYLAQAGLGATRVGVAETTPSTPEEATEGEPEPEREPEPAGVR